MMTPAESMWAGITGLVREVKQCEAAGFTMAALALAYVGIDTMAYLAMPADQSEQTRQDFIAWVDTYLKAHADQPYQYRGLDVYAARCGVLHAFSAEAGLHRRDLEIRVFGYHSGGKHFMVESPKTVFIGTASLLNDIVIAIEGFLKACEDDASLRARVVARLPNLLQTFPILTPYPSRSGGSPSA
jgi:hypothetical protein